MQPSNFEFRRGIDVLNQELLGCVGKKEVNNGCIPYKMYERDGHLKQGDLSLNVGTDHRDVAHLLD